jgi:hypothetical protein
MRHQEELRLGLHRRERRLNLTPSCGGETAKQFVKRHIAMGNAGPHLRHRQLKRVLERRGFVVKTIERKDYHPIWSLSLRPGTVTDAWDNRVVRRNVSKALLELGHKCPPKDVGAVVAGQVLQVSFGWNVGKPGILTFWSQPLWRCQPWFLVFIVRRRDGRRIFIPPRSKRNIFTAQIRTVKMFVKAISTDCALCNPLNGCTAGRQSHSLILERRDRSGKDN